MKVNLWTPAAGGRREATQRGAMRQVDVGFLIAVSTAS